MDRSKTLVRNLLQKNPFVTKSTVEKLLQIPAFRRQLSSALDTKYGRKPIRADIPMTIKGKYVRFRITDPKKFDPKSFRVIRLKGTDTKMTVACPKGSFVKGVCRVGMKPQSVMIPISRVIALAGRYAQIPEVRKIAANPEKRYDIVRFYSEGERPRVMQRGLTLEQARKHCQDPRTREEGVWFDGYSKSGDYGNNPLLMVAQNKKMAKRMRGRVTLVMPSGKYKTVSYKIKRRKLSRNPLLMVAANPNVKPCPFKEDIKIPIAKFEGWLKLNGNPEEIRRYHEAKAKYKRFHLGAEPKTVSRNILKIGSKRITDRDFLYNAGVSPADLYKTAGYSGKANNNSGYIHHWKDKPDVNITRDGKTIIKPLKGGARIDDWMRG